MNAPVTMATMLRRFQIPDLDRHGKWILPRLLAAYPHLTERTAAGFLAGIVYQNDSLFLYQSHSVALAQMVGSHTLAPKPIVWERFVWVEDPNDKQQVEDAAVFYDEFARWAKAQGCETIVVEEMTDVPHEIIKQKLGRVFNRQQQFARL